MKIPILLCLCLVLEEIHCCAARNSKRHRITDSKLEKDHTSLEKQRCSEIRQRIGNLTSAVTGAVRSLDLGISTNLEKHNRRRLDREQRLLERLGCENIEKAISNATTGLSNRITNSKIADRINIADRQKGNSTGTEDKAQRKNRNKVGEGNKIAERQQSKGNSKKDNNSVKKNKVEDRQKVAESTIGNLTGLVGKQINKVTDRQQNVNNGTRIAVKQNSNKNNQTVANRVVGGVLKPVKQSLNNVTKVSGIQKAGNATRGVLGNVGKGINSILGRHESGNSWGGLIQDRQKNGNMMKRKPIVKRQAYPDAETTTVAETTTIAETTTAAAETSTAGPGGYPS
ncbi:uncharacterized protein LOC128993403 [Macrosteles quadrilineatus]|uniref:uncharacterized protein LOC128993403 n=1 Tax=Macrosteles quadrilineatus TaxID=74068 RepID=UPI0023E172AC|nr:uncharacterized protein LOC128993403 [Macrosteles quadrilineatus]